MNSADGVTDCGLPLGEVYLTLVLNLNWERLNVAKVSC